MPAFKTFFMFASGLDRTVRVPRGTVDNIRNHIDDTTRQCKLKIVKFGDNPPHWNQYEPAADIDNDTASHLVRGHNRWVELLYEKLGRWTQSPPEEYEELTPEIANELWYGFSMLHLPVHRWSQEYFQEEMQELFDVMRGHDVGGIIWDEEPLAPKQAAAVIQLFESYLDNHDSRLELSHGHGMDGQLLNKDQYLWCPEDGAIPCHLADEDDEGCAICPECGKAFE